MNRDIKNGKKADITADAIVGQFRRPSGVITRGCQYKACQWRTRERGVRLLSISGFPAWIGWQ